MANFRPAGFSDEDSDSDDYGFYEKPTRQHFYAQQTLKKKVEDVLQDAIINGDLKRVEEIIQTELNGDVNVKLDSGWTPLMHACFHAQDKIVEYLLNKNADPNLHADSVTPIMVACSNSSASNDIIYNIITNLINKDCILNVGDRYGQTPLMRAIGSGQVAVVQKLIDMKVNIEMRDQQGWTAVFWAAHHNQPEILELLIDKGARLKEVDRSSRTPYDIASSHDYENIIEILKEHLKISDNDSELDNSVYLNTEISCWQDFYPGINKTGKPSYKDEIPHLLYGMGCERLTPLITSTGMNLRTFLLLEEQDMTDLQIDMPYERQRLKNGLRNFHARGWKLNSVAGLYARKIENFSVLDCLTSLGSHLQQVYIMEATLQYTLREYAKVESQIKFEPPDSPVLLKLRTAGKKLLTNINSTRREIRSMRNVLKKISRNNPYPADLIVKKSALDTTLNYIARTVSICSLGFILYNGRTVFLNIFKK